MWPPDPILASPLPPPRRSQLPHPTFSLYSSRSSCSFLNMLSPRRSADSSSSARSSRTMGGSSRLPGRIHQVTPAVTRRKASTATGAKGPVRQAKGKSPRRQTATPKKRAASSSPRRSSGRRKVGLLFLVVFASTYTGVQLEDVIPEPNR